MTKRHVQTMTLRHGRDPVTIVTPLGRIFLTRPENDNRKIDISLPPGMLAVRGKVEDKDKKVPEFVVEQKDGTFDANFTSLLPELDDVHRVIGYYTSEVFRLNASKEKQDERSDVRSPEMADA